MTQPLCQVRTPTPENGRHEPLRALPGRREPGGPRTPGRHRRELPPATREGDDGAGTLVNRVCEPALDQGRSARTS